MLELPNANRSSATVDPDEEQHIATQAEFVASKRGGRPVSSTPSPIGAWLAVVSGFAAVAVPEPIRDVLRTACGRRLRYPIRPAPPHGFGDENSGDNEDQRNQVKKSDVFVEDEDSEKRPEERHQVCEQPSPRRSNQLDPA